MPHARVTHLRDPSRRGSLASCKITYFFIPIIISYFRPNNRPVWFVVHDILCTSRTGQLFSLDELLLCILRIVFIPDLENDLALLVMPEVEPV